MKDSPENTRSMIVNRYHFFFVYYYFIFCGSYFVVCVSYTARRFFLIFDFPLTPPHDVQSYCCYLSCCWGCYFILKKKKPGGDEVVTSIDQVQDKNIIEVQLFLLLFLIFDFKIHVFHFGAFFLLFDPEKQKKKRFLLTNKKTFMVLRRCETSGEMCRRNCSSHLFLKRNYLRVHTHAHNFKQK